MLKVSRSAPLVGYTDNDRMVGVLPANYTDGEKRGQEQRSAA
jgi:hypothetical protein